MLGYRFNDKGTLPSIQNRNKNNNTTLNQSNENISGKGKLHMDKKLRNSMEQYKS